MKTIIYILLSLLPFSAISQTIAPSPTYTISNGIVYNSSGQQDDDPQEPVYINNMVQPATAAPTLDTFTEINDNWKGRQNAATQRLASDPSLAQ